MKKFHSALILAAVATSIATSITPAQAITWEELWNGIKQGLQSPQQGSNPQQSNFNNGTQQAGGFSNENPQPQASPQPQATPQATNNYSAPSAPTPRKVYLQTRCTNSGGQPATFIGRDDSDSMISAGQRAIRVDTKVSLWVGDTHQTTCAIIRHPSSGKIAVAHAIPDNSNLQSARVSFYVDGQEKFSGIIYRGQAGGRFVNITGASSFSITLQALNGNGDIYSPVVRQP